MRIQPGDILCPICLNKMQAKIAEWSYYCLHCDYWSAILDINICSQDDPIFNNYGENNDLISFLDSIRVKNYIKILAKAKSLSKKKYFSILDVGCATGLFINTAKKRGHVVIGVEPNPIMAKNASEKGLKIIKGYFPTAVSSKSKYDVIIFNDVFEHIPNLSSILDNCKFYLNDDGMLIISLPNSDGIIFNIAQLLNKIGFKAPWERLWQVRFYTPHLHYFNPKSLDSFLKKHKFVNCLNAIEIEAINLDGLWNRIKFDSTVNLATKIFLFIGILLLYPIIKMSTKDTFFSIYKIQNK